MEKMNPEVKARWVAALRSGEYKQGKNALQRDGKFCCLGVLCEIAVQEGVISADRRGGLSVLFYDGNSAALGPAVRHWSGIADEAGSFGSEIITVSLDNGRDMVRSTNLMSLNDLAGYTFEQIADVIEEYL